MIKINERSLLTLFFFLFALVILIQSFGLRNDVALVPKIMASIMVAFTLLQLVNDLFPGVQKRLPFLNKRSDTPGEGDSQEEEGTRESFIDRYLMIGWMMLFVILIYVTNMIWAILISFFIYLRWMAKASWKVTIFYTLGFAVSIYLLFVVGMGIYYFW